MVIKQLTVLKLLTHSTECNKTNENLMPLGSKTGARKELESYLRKTEKVTGTTRDNVL